MKLGNLYDLNAFSRFKDSGETLKQKFSDSAPGVVLAQYTTAIDPRVFEKKYPELTFVNCGIQANNMGGYGRVIESLRVIEQGDFADASDVSDNRGKISIFGENNLIPVYEKHAFSSWSDTEIKQADSANINLVSRFLEAHNRIYLQKIDTIGYLGQFDAQGNATNPGLLNNTYFPTTSAPAQYSTYTPQQSYDVIAGFITQQWAQVFNTPEYMAMRVAMPQGFLNLITTQILNSAAGSFSVLKSLRDNFPGIEFLSTPKTLDRMVGFSINDQAMQMRIPVPLTVGEIVKKTSFTYEVDSKFRVAGLDVLEADAGLIMTGLAS
jgi:hypothetical protein